MEALRTQRMTREETYMARVLAISAHPDDELFGGGYLAKLASEFIIHIFQ